MHVGRERHSAGARWMKRLLSGLSVLGLLALAGCGGGANPVSSALPSVPTAQKACSTCGTALVSLSDAPGDFVSYLVTVDSLTLTRSDGQVVQTVPQSTQVDFAQLVNLSEILSAEQIPEGRYTSATLTLDYSQATLVLDTASGSVTVPAGNILDATTGQPLTGTVQVTLSLGSGTPLVVTPGAVSHLALDFNLAASNTVDLNTSPPTVTVNPVLTASLLPASGQQVHVRGPLLSVSSADSDYVVTVRPFEDSNDDFGQLTVDTTATTQFLINGTAYTGAAGLAELATLPANTLTSAYGSWDRTSNTFTASIVHAGSSVAGVSGPAVQGTVVARSGDTLTLQNALVLQRPSSNSDDDLGFQRQVTVSVGPGTAVTEQGETGSFSSTDISVGQQARFSGTLTTGSAGTSLDATGGSALLLPTQGVGLLTTAASGLLTVDLQSLGHVQASALDFTGTGTGTGGTSGPDATAAAYEVAIPSSFSTASLTDGLPVQFTGFVAPFGAAPPDFSAFTVVSYGQADAQLHLSWASPGTPTAFSGLSSTGLLINQATLQAASTQVLRIEDTSIDPSSLASGLELVPQSGSTEDGEDTSFAIAHAMSQTTDSFSTFADLTTALNTDLSTASVLGVSAQGTYGASGVLTVSRLVVVLNN